MALGSKLEPMKLAPGPSQAGRSARKRAPVKEKQAETSHKILIYVSSSLKHMYSLKRYQNLFNLI